MNLLGAIIFAALLLLVLCSSRRWAAMGMMAGVLYLTTPQQIHLMGINLSAMRLLLLAAFVRVMARHEFSPPALNRLDKTLLLTYIFTAAVCFIRSTQDRVTMVGVALDVFFGYFSFRGLLRDADEFRWFLLAFVVLLVPYAMLMVMAGVTSHNVFTILGADSSADWVRHGRIRCMGSFRHPDLLGTLGAAFFPLYIAIGCTKERRKIAMVGAVCCLAIVWASNSGGPLCAIAAGVVGWLLWPMRARMKMVRRGMVALIAIMAVVMKAPVWYIMARASSVSGGTGWHRAYLIDVATQHLDQWWLAGMHAADTGGWFPYALAATGGSDITNQFLSFGISAGLGAVVLFMLLLVRGFSALGGALALVRANGGQPDKNEFLLWGLGVMLAVHIINWFGITYFFDQTYVIWLMQLAAISGVTETIARNDAIVSGEPHLAQAEVFAPAPDAALDLESR